MYYNTYTFVLICFICQKIVKAYSTKKEKNKKNDIHTEQESILYEYTCVTTINVVETLTIKTEKVNEPFTDVKNFTEVIDLSSISADTPESKILSNDISSENVEKIKNTKILPNSFINELIKFYGKNAKALTALQAFIAFCGFIQTAEALTHYFMHKGKGIFALLYLLIFLYSFVNTINIIEESWKGYNGKFPEFKRREIFLLLLALFALLIVIIFEWLLKTTLIKKLALSLICFFKKFKKA